MEEEVPATRQPPLWIREGTPTKSKEALDVGVLWTGGWWSRMDYEFCEIIVSVVGWLVGWLVGCCCCMSLVGLNFWHWLFSNIKSIVGIGGFENGIGGGRRGHTHGTNHVCIVKVENLKSRKPTKDNWFHPADSFIQK